MKSNPTFREFLSLTLNFHFQNLSKDSSSSFSTWTTRNAPLSHFPDYGLLVNNMGGTSALKMYAIADEILLQLSKFPLLLKSRCIPTNLVKIQQPSLA